MKRIVKLNNDRQIFKALAVVLSGSHKYKSPSYKLLVNYLNSNDLKTTGVIAGLAKAYSGIYKETAFLVFGGYVTA
jgi:hypothetical protein